MTGFFKELYYRIPPAGDVVLVVNVEQIRGRDTSLDVEVPIDQLPELGKLDPREGCFLEPVSVKLRLDLVGEMLLARGRLAAKVDQSCSRCLNDYVLNLDLDVALTFERRMGESAEEQEEDVELSAEELGVIMFDGDEVDLAAAVAEQLLLALPYRPLCSEECQGLCSHCGADLNLGPCKCQPEEKDNPFAVLKNLRID